MSRGAQTRALALSELGPSSTCQAVQQAQSLSLTMLTLSRTTSAAERWTTLQLVLPHQMCLCRFGAAPMPRTVHSLWLDMLPLSVFHQVPRTFEEPALLKFAASVAQVIGSTTSQQFPTHSRPDTGDSFWEAGGMMELHNSDVDNAELQALLEGLHAAADHAIRQLAIKLSSNTLLKSLHGKVKAACILASKEGRTAHEKNPERLFVAEHIAAHNLTEQPSMMASLLLGAA